MAMDKDEVKEATMIAKLMTDIYKKEGGGYSQKEALTTLIALANLYLSGELVERASVEEIDKVKDNFMCDFPKPYTNMQIVAYQRGIIMFPKMVEALYNLGVGK
jgi:hypothetical protein